MLEAVGQTFHWYLQAADVRVINHHLARASDSLHIKLASIKAFVQAAYEVWSVRPSVLTLKSSC